MNDSAESPRERRRRETELALVRGARTLTAEIGLSGFTVEEVCERAGISRRTFFNYFASKEDAVLGFGLHRDDEEAESVFVAAGTGDGTLSPTLLDDLAALLSARWARMDVAPETITELFAAVDREPRLLPRILQHAGDMERQDAALIEKREGLPEGDLRARVAAQLIGAIARDTIAAFLGAGPHDPPPHRPADHGRSYADLYAERLDAARDIFLSQNLHPKGTRA